MDPLLQILECTLRDGSYLIDFQFTAEDTLVVSRALEETGFRLIEVGHGNGLGASERNVGGVAAATDESYLRAASRALTKAKFGAFFIPGIGEKRHLDMARDCGMSFVRVGTNITQSDEARDYILYAKRLGFDVSYNAMKSYVVTPAEFIRRTKQTTEWGADTVYLVDSAGGMLPHQVKEYVVRMRQELGVTLGFHGHNNFGLANANNLAALEAGAVYLDSTLQGMGRSSGNAQTEIMVLLYEKLGLHTGVDPLKCMEIGEKLIRPRIRAGHGISALEITLANAQFHSSHLPRVSRAAEQYGVDLMLLITEVSKVDRVNPSDALIGEVACRLAAK